MARRKLIKTLHGAADTFFTFCIIFGAICGVQEIINALLNFILPKIINTSHDADQYRIFSFVIITFGIASYALLHTAFELSKSGQIAIGRFLGILGFLAEAFIIISAIAILLEARQYEAWIESRIAYWAEYLNSTDVASLVEQYSTEFRYWIGILTLLCGIAGNGVGVIAAKLLERRE